MFTKRATLTPFCGLVIIDGDGNEYGDKVWQEMWPHIEVAAEKEKEDIAKVFRKLEVQYITVSAI
jgi:hypothetical protein